MKEKVHLEIKANICLNDAWEKCSPKLPLKTEDLNRILDDSKVCVHVDCSCLSLILVVDIVF